MYYSIGNFFPLVERNIHEISTIDPKIVTLKEFLRAKRVTFADNQKKALKSSESEKKTLIIKKAFEFYL